MYEDTQRQVEGVEFNETVRGSGVDVKSTTNISNNYLSNFMQ